MSTRLMERLAFQMMKPHIFCASFGFSAMLLSYSAPAEAARCGIPDSIVDKVTREFVEATTTVGGGLFTPKMMWAALVDREGRLCQTIKTGDAWPGSRAIAIAKVSTANDFSNTKFALSTANLYGVSLPGASLFGLN